MTIVKYCFEEYPEIKVNCVASGALAVQEALKEVPDLVILDVMMPKPNGIETLEILKTLPTLAKVPVMFLTAKVQPHEIASYYRLGVAFVIIKPFDPGTLVEIVLAEYQKQLKKAS